MKSHASMRWRIPPVAWLPIGLAIGAESLSNALRAYGLGEQLERFTVAFGPYPISLSGVVLVLGAVAVSLTQTAAAWKALTPSGPARQRFVAGIVGSLLLAISVTAMASHILEAGRAKTGGENHERNAYALAKSDYDKAEAELTRLGSVRSTDEVKAGMDKARVPKWAWEETTQCTATVMGVEAAKACRPILDLRVEMAQAISKRDAESARNAAKARLAGLTPAPEATADEAIVSRVWAWILGLGVVFIATFGSVIFARVEVAVPRAANDVAALPPIPEDEPPGDEDDVVVSWVREFRRMKGRPPQIPELQAAFPGTPKTTAWRRCKAA